MANENADLNLPLYWVPTWSIREVEVFPSLEKVVHAASAHSGATAVGAVEIDIHFQRHTIGNQTATAHLNNPATSW